MKLGFCSSILSVFVLAGFSTSALAATVELQESFTSAQNGTLPASLTADYDPGVDVAVVPLASMQPVPTVDHPGGDGYVLRVGDIGSGGGAWDFVEPANFATMNLANSRVSAWVYTEWDSNPDGSERDYILYSRRDPTAGMVQASGTQRRMYLFMISENSSWAGVTPNPANYRPYILVRENITGAYSMVGTQYGTDIPPGWHFMELICAGSTITGKVDGVTVVTGTDTSYTSGYGGIGYYDDNVSDTVNNPFAAAFDNLKIESFSAAVADWTIY